MPEPTVFLSRSFPVCSIIRPTETRGAAAGAVAALKADGLFNGQSNAFFAELNELAAKADMAQRRGWYLPIRDFLFPRPSRAPTSPPPPATGTARASVAAARPGAGARETPDPPLKEN